MRDSDWEAGAVAARARELLAAPRARADAGRKTGRGPFLRDAGVYEPGREYGPGDVVTHAGTIWSCRAKTTERPGTDGWRLMVKTR